MFFSEILLRQILLNLMSLYFFFRKILQKENNNKIFIINNC